MGLCLGIAAFGFLVGAVWAYFKQRRQMESRVPATGTVVEFSMPSGESVRFTSDFGSRPASHKIGQTVNIRYDPGDPQKAESESAMTLWLTPLILVFMGAVACCLTVAFLGVYILDFLHKSQGNHEENLSNH